MQTILRLVLAMSVAAGSLTGTARAAAPVRHYADPSHRFHFDFPSACTSKRGTGDQSDVISCNNGAAYVTYAAGGTDEPALQRLVNRIIGDWSGMQLIRNDRHTQFDGKPSRTMFAVGTRPDHEVANIQIVAVPRDGGWYALVMQSWTWETDKLRYFKAIADSFHFDERRSR